jgi:hypothetical protein
MSKNYDYTNSGVFSLIARYAIGSASPRAIKIHSPSCEAANSVHAVSLPPDIKTFAYPADYRYVRSQPLHPAFWLRTS